MESIMDAMVKRSRKVDGVPTSLCDLGYCDVGLDDNWQDCKAGAGHNHYHDAEGNPVINLERFPDMKSMVDHAHRLGLTAGWYGNNCICSDHHTTDKKYYEGDVKAFRKFGFDSWKLDGCGAQVDMQLWDDLLKADGGKPVMVENCHWGSMVPYEPNRTWCPWNFYRSSGDIRAKYSSVVANLNSVTKFSSRNLSYPGCWAYPDMLELGVQNGAGGRDDPGLSMPQTIGHFSAWVIISAPLIISFDVTNETVMDELWPIISNKEVLEISQTYAGFSGGIFKNSKDTVVLDTINHALMEKGMTEEHLASQGPLVVPRFQYLYKPLGPEKIAVLIMNHGNTTANAAFNYREVPGLNWKYVNVRNPWDHHNLGPSSGGFSLKMCLPQHSFLITLTPYHGPHDAVPETLSAYQGNSPTFV
jgi:alpha-galactosidase